MERTRTTATLTALAAALLMIGLFHGLDLWWDAAKAYNSMSFQILPFFLQAIIINLLFAISVIAMNWFVNVKMRPNKQAAWALVALGGLLTFYPVLFAGSMALPLLGALYPVTLLSKACAFIAVIGVIGVFRKPGR